MVPNTSLCDYSLFSSLHTFWQLSALSAAVDWSGWKLHFQGTYLRIFYNLLQEVLAPFINSETNYSTWQWNSVRFLFACSWCTSHNTIFSYLPVLFSNYRYVYLNIYVFIYMYMSYTVRVSVCYIYTQNRFLVLHERNPTQTGIN